MPEPASARPVIAVLSTSFSGGTYFANVLAGIARATADAGGRILAIQTCPAGDPSLDLVEPPSFRLPVAWDHISGVAVILNAARPDYLESVRAAGKPVVMISDALPGFTCPVALPDNRSGVVQAVEHLISHGHRRIAFAGFRVSRDIKERYEAYRDCLLANGILPEDDLVYDTGNNQVWGGEAAARAMITAGLPSTAVITGNDHNAIGLIQALTAAGYDLPSDQAVVGFDDLERVVYLAPNLSTVRQDFARVGVFATELLLRQIRGETVADGCHYVPTEFIARESCGCPSTLSLRSEDIVPENDVRSPEELRTRLMAISHARTRNRSADRQALERGADMVGSLVCAAVHDEPLPPLRAVWHDLAGLHELCPDLESLIQVIRVVRRYGRETAATWLDPTDDGGVRRLEDALQEATFALLLALARSNTTDVDNYELNFTVQHAVSMRLLRSGDEEDPRGLGWLNRTTARAATFALWRTDGEGRTPASPLRVVGSFHADEPGWRPRDEPVTVEAFPSDEMVEMADPSSDDMVFVVPLTTAGGEDGLLAVAGPIEPRLYYGREVVNQWAALLSTALDRRSLLESLRTQEELLRRAALYDALTGLPNRTLLFDRLKQAIAQAKRFPSYQFALCMLDLDGFKLVNDSLGHLAGDELLVEAAQRLRSCLRETDFAARLGGDEFAVLLAGVLDEEGAEVVVSRLREALAQPYVVAEQEVMVTASVGVALSTRGYDSPEELIRDSDIAMYSAKTNEKGTHAVFDVTMHVRAVDRLRLEGELRRAVDQGELELQYQPIVELGTGRAVAFEALLRWRHPDRGLLGPEVFLPVAEESGLIVPIGRWVIAEGCHQLAEWRREFGDGLDVRLSLNVSGRQFWAGHLLQDLEESLGRWGLDGRRITVEITEAVIMRDVPAARRVLDRLREVGVAVHIDDFGTGYSSLEALNHLPIDALKIDRSFVLPLPGDRRSEELVRAIIAMSRSLGFGVVAEGIETVEQSELLFGLGCELGQGYRFARPMPAAATGRYLRTSGRVGPAAVRSGSGTATER
ncbi:MAG: hypothetical protein QG622_463 [Actinomycetota bacterium]|nr:hypothetical protein [Actinomycetota bacterium]